MNMATTITAAHAPAGDQAILDAFAARRQEFEAAYDTEMTPEEEEGYFRRLDACEMVILDTPATSIDAIIVKLRITFMHQEGSAWSDRAILDPSHPEFVAGLAASDIYTRMKWSAIEELARIGDVDLATQALAPATVQHGAASFETMRLEYLALDHEINTTVADAEHDPRFQTMQQRMQQIELDMSQLPSRSIADARTKMQFMLDTDRIGVPLDGEEAHVLVKDAARFLLGKGAGA